MKMNDSVPFRSMKRNSGFNSQLKENINRANSSSKNNALLSSGYSPPSSIDNQMGYDYYRPIASNYKMRSVSPKQEQMKKAAESDKLPSRSWIPSINVNVSVDAIKKYWF